MALPGAYMAVNWSGKWNSHFPLLFKTGPSGYFPCCLTCYLILPSFLFIYFMQHCLSLHLFGLLVLCNLADYHVPVWTKSEVYLHHLEHYVVFLVVYKGESYLGMWSSNAGLEKLMLSRPSNKCSARIYPLVHVTFHDMFKDAEYFGHGKFWSGLTFDSGEHHRCAFSPPLYIASLMIYSMSFYHMLHMLFSPC